MKILIRGYNIERLANENVCVYVKGMDLIDNTLYIVDNDKPYDASEFKDVLHLVAKGSVRTHEDVALTDPSDEGLLKIFNKFGKLIKRSDD